MVFYIYFNVFSVCLLDLQIYRNKVYLLVIIRILWETYIEFWFSLKFLKYELLSKEFKIKSFKIYQLQVNQNSKKITKRLKFTTKQMFNKNDNFKRILIVYPSYRLQSFQKEPHYRLPSATTDNLKIITLTRRHFDSLAISCKIIILMDFKESRRIS